MKYYVCFFETFEEEKLHIQKKLEQDKKLEQVKYEVCYIEDTIQEWLQKNPHQTKPVRVGVFCFKYDAMFTEPLAPDGKLN